jgi:hypothetical protein
MNGKLPLKIIRIMNTIGYFEIQSSNPEREIGFYENIFGWQFIREEFVPIEYYRIATNSINGGLLKRPAEVLPGEGHQRFCLLYTGS